MAVYFNNNLHLPDFMNRALLIYFYLLLFAPVLAFAGGNKPVSANMRERINFNAGWKFHFAYDVNKQPQKISVTLPHTWNANDVLSGIVNYRREAGIYEKNFFVSNAWKQKRLFLYFEGANSVASVFINKHFIAEHKGGYTCFCIEITNYVKTGQQNSVEVQVSNAIRQDVLPLVGDFNVYGGIHRPVSLLVTSKDCISPLDHASPGVYLTPVDVSAASATVNILTKLSVTDKSHLQVSAEIMDANNHMVAATSGNVTDNMQCTQVLKLKSPHLWNGRSSPYLYTAVIKLLRNGRVIDNVTQPLGIRYFKVDADKGFSLNGKYLDLHGLGFHEDVQGKGSALDTADYDRDMQLINEIGATTLRLTHYPHGKYFYDLCDRNGLVLWSEIPFVGPGGYSGDGYIKSSELESHVKQVLTELIRQNYNHPSIFFWGLFNELKLDHDNPVPFLKQLNALAKKEDPTRLTTCASFLDSTNFNGVTDLIAWNKYFGWYGGEFKDLGVWADKMHSQTAPEPIAISEFGAGGSPFKHWESKEKPSADSRFHPEEWQTLYHEESWRELQKRQFMWGKYVWALADFGSSIRNEGDTPGVNDKGLVTYDRSIKKDAFYFYKVNWNTEPMVYITDRRNTTRNKPVTDIKVYSNVPGVSLKVNGIVQGGTRDPDELHIITWENIELKKGPNKIEITSEQAKHLLHDECEWTLQ